MSLKVRDINNTMETYAPSCLKESYDNVGLMVGDLDSQVTSIMIALDCTIEVIKEAVEKNCNLILTHHPLLFLKPGTITRETLQGRKIIELIQNNINVYSSHTNLDIVKDGLNDILTKLLGYNHWSIIETSVQNHEGEAQGIGRLVFLDRPTTLEQLCERVKACLNINGLRYAGEEKMQVNKIAIINGSGEDYFKAAIKCGADCIITGDTSYHYVSDYMEMGIGIIDAGHFETEWPSMKVIADVLRNKLREQGYDNLVLVSEKCRSPYKFF
jgi:dinuclear metal center YbgI/SA1388 family protein